MAQHGVNGATEATLNERFVKCPNCNVNISKTDFLKIGKCSICNHQWINTDVECVEFEKCDVNIEKKKNRKRWVVLVSKRGKEYYHNTETGEDQWERPPDYDAEVSGDQFGKCFVFT